MPNFGIFVKKGELDLPPWTVLRSILTRAIHVARLFLKRKCLERPIPPEKIGALLHGDGFAQQDLKIGKTWMT